MRSGTIMSGSSERMIMDVWGDFLPEREWALCSEEEDLGDLRISA